MGKLINIHTNSGHLLDCVLINRTTQQAERVIRSYEYTKKGDSIFTAYGKPSSAKISAFNEIVKEMNRVSGFGMRITGAGSDVFSCAYQIRDGSGIIYLIYHTPCYRYALEYKVPEWIEANRR